MAVSLEEIKSVKNLDQLKKLVAKPIIRKDKFIYMSHRELSFLGRFLAIVGLECSIAIQEHEKSTDLTRSIKFCNAIKNWYASGRYDNSIYHREALLVLSECWYLNSDSATNVKLFEFSGAMGNKDPVPYFNSAFYEMERLRTEKIDVLPSLKLALIYEEMNVYEPKFHYKIEDSY